MRLCCPVYSFRNMSPCHGLTLKAPPPAIRRLVAAHHNPRSVRPTCGLEPTVSANAKNRLWSGLLAHTREIRGPRSGTTDAKRSVRFSVLGEPQLRALEWLKRNVLEGIRARSTYSEVHESTNTS